MIRREMIEHTLTTSHPCDTALYPLSELQNSNDGMFAELDFSTLSPDYASKKGIFDPANVKQRAREVRRWLRARPEKEVVGECFITFFPLSSVSRSDSSRCARRYPQKRRLWRERYGCKCSHGIPEKVG